MTPTILLVEDDANDAFLVTRAFTKAEVDARFRHVRDGEEVIAYLTGSGHFADRTLHPFPDLAFLDLKLPRRSGLEVLEWMKDQPRIRRIPVIVLTSSRDGKDVESAYDLGASSFLVKPVDFEQLVVMARDIAGYWLRWNRFPSNP